MENDLEQEIHNLAYHIWQSAGSEIGRALDFWLMAERMVIELAADSARLANTAATSAWEATSTWPSALRSLYFYRIRDLARHMWLASNEQQERSLDYWLAAEKHLRLLMNSTVRAAGASLGKEEILASAFEAFSPADYLEHIRKTAYQLWEAAGRQYGSAFDFWLAAEEKILGSANPSETASTAENANPSVPPSPIQKRRRRSSRPQ
ncbi:MAG: DUF2934 domain-containing protein [Candidatus Competibacter sp.]|nr:DUF2934 domain-containing protein [Candidatus Competibacter sp.]MDG4584299.1 DUF2934 domain-containing protein [Candidatus Competibacter sp.]